MIGSKLPEHTEEIDDFGLKIAKVGFPRLKLKITTHTKENRKEKKTQKK